MLKEQEINLTDILHAKNWFLKFIGNWIKHENWCVGNSHFLHDISHLHISLIHPNNLFACQDAESRAEYGEMNVQRIHLQIDQLEDELIGQKQKCKAINDELQQTFNDMVEQYWPLLLLILISYHATWNTSLLHIKHWSMEDFTFNYKVVLAIKDMAQNLTWKRVTIDRITQCATTKVIHGRYSSHLNI